MFLSLVVLFSFYGNNLSNEPCNDKALTNYALSFVPTSEVNESKTNYSSKVLLDTFFFGKAPKRSVDTNSPDYKTASKLKGQSFFPFKVSEFSNMIDEGKNLDTFSQYLGQMNMKSAYYVGPGCLAESLYVYQYDGISVLHYDLYTYFRIDLSQNSTWETKLKITKTEILRSLETAYKKSEDISYYLALNDGCTAQESEDLCYEPLIFMMYHEDTPVYIYFAFYMSC